MSRNSDLTRPHHTLRDHRYRTAGGVQPKPWRSSESTGLLAPGCGNPRPEPGTADTWRQRLPRPRSCLRPLTMLPVAEPLFSHEGPQLIQFYPTDGNLPHHLVVHGFGMLGATRKPESDRVQFHLKDFRDTTQAHTAQQQLDGQKDSVLRSPQIIEGGSAPFTEALAATATKEVPHGPASSSLGAIAGDIALSRLTILTAVLIRTCNISELRLRPTSTHPNHSHLYRMEVVYCKPRKTSSY